MHHLPTLWIVLISISVARLISNQMPALPHVCPVVCQPSVCQLRKPTMVQNEINNVVDVLLLALESWCTPISTHTHTHISQYHPGNHRTQLRWLWIFDIKDIVAFGCHISEFLHKLKLFNICYWDSKLSFYIKK